jgi:hypothetical protein
MKKKIALIITAAIMMVATIIGGTMAASRPEASVKQELKTSNVDIEAYPADGLDISGAIPGKKIPAEGGVRNTGSQPVYLRVAVNKYWCDSNDKRDFEADAKQIEVNIDQNKWIVHDDDDYGELLYCYYREPLKDGNDAEVMTEVILLKDFIGNSNKYAGLKCHIDFDADAVQIVPGDINTSEPSDAMLAEWGIEVYLNEDGTINKVIDK